MVLGVLHEPNYNLKAIIVAIVNTMNWFQTVLLDFTNIYSIAEYEKPSLLFYLEYIIL